MAPHKFELSDISDSQTNLTTATNRKNSGCHVSTLVGFVLILLAAVVAVGVGIIVHFAGGNRDVVCNCKPSTAAILDECVNMAGQGNADICQKCPPSPSTHSSATTVSSVSLPTAGTSSTPAATEAPKVTDVRLPTSVYPVHYDVELQPYMHRLPQNFTFRGSVSILLRCVVATDNVTLHFNVLTINTSSIRFSPEDSAGVGQPQYVGYDTDSVRQFFIVKLNRNMEVGQRYLLQMTFTSPLRNDLTGLYYSQYTRDNQTIYLATTQFQPTDARKAFPCFDEPAIKSSFNITLVRPSDRISISNMPIIDSSNTFQEDGITYVKDVYQTTPVMSTYLLAFIVCDFNYTYNITKNDVLYRAWAPPQSVDQTHYSLKTGIDIIEYFEDYFNVSYPLPKQDMIAIPDFAAGAMENWGLITYRETAMLYKPGVSNEANQERVAIVVSHELAHQWFGNLVTPSWWDDLWLNEGFASFVEYMGVNEVHPEWRMFEKFVISDVQGAFDFDGLISSHPVYVPVGHPDEINEIFDTISYAKGASIIRMMRHFLGEETFRRGITNYLRAHSYMAAFHDDLWQSLTQQALAEGKDKIDVKTIMDTWTLQMNFPVVTVTIDQGLLRVTQARYLSDPTAKDPEKYNSPFGYRWTIPLTFTSSNNPRFIQDDSDVHWMTRNETNKIFSSPSLLPDVSDPQGWILANVQQYGYYRVNYDLGNWRALGRQLETNHSVISIINRAQIINDAWNLAKAGHIGLDVALATIEYLHNEHDYVPWYAAYAELNFVETMLSFTSLYGPFQSFMRDMLNATFHDFGLENIQLGHIDVATQVLIAQQSCYYGIRTCLDQVSSQFRRWMNTPSENPIDPNLKNLVYCHSIANGGWEEWQFALERYNLADVASEKTSLLYGMGCSKQPWILNHYMKSILQSNSPIRMQDALSVVSYVARNNIGRHLAWNFFRGNYDALKAKFGSSFFAWSNVIRVLTVSFNTEFEYKEVSAFQLSQSRNLGSGARAFSQALEKVASNIKWMSRNEAVITKWLKDKNYLSD